MPVNGPYLNRLRTELRAWAPKYRQELIKALEMGGVYGTRKLSTQEQLDRFMEMKPLDYQMLILRLQTRYKGLPNMDNLVNRDLAAFMNRMISLMITKGQMPAEEYELQLGELESQLGLGGPV